MPENIPLNEKCKIAVWMEQFKSAEIVQLKYKKEFSKKIPSLQSIEEIHHLFMTTGSVTGRNSNGDMVKENDQKLKLRRGFVTNDEDSRESGIKEEILEEAYPLNDTFEEEEDEIGEDYLEENEKEDAFVSILKEEIAIEDREYAEISVNEGESEAENSLNSAADCFSCFHCGFKTLDRASFEMHQKAHSLKDFFRCKLCTFTSNSTNLFRTHKKNCTGTPASKESNICNKLNLIPELNCHTCEQCGKAYSSVSSLKMHQAYHSKLRPYACDKCDYRFLSQTTLKKHLLTHDKIKHLECPHCSFKCNMSGNMIIHARTHSGEKPYRCTECPYRTGNPSVFKRHTAAHRNEVTFRCGQCNYKTHKSSLLENHEKGHSAGAKFQCHLCKEYLRNSYALRYHMTKQHSEQEVLECPFCDFCQRDKALLKIHIRRHTGEKPYACPVEDCAYRAMRSQDLKKHLAKAH